MAIIKFPSNSGQSQFFEDIVEDGYHVFSLKNAKTPGFYPNEFPDYPGVRLSDLKPDDIITIRVFFRVGLGKNVRADGGYIDLKVEHVEDNAKSADWVLTQEDLKEINEILGREDN